MMSSNEAKGRALAADGVHQTALALLGTLPKDARIADLPCGEGALTNALLERGYRKLVAGDIDDGQIRLDGEAEKVRIDLSREIDLPDATFDAVLNIECIEHLENPFLLMRELARILKPGGTLILSTPNILSVDARSKYLSAGYFPWFINLAHHWQSLRAEGFMGHITPVALTQLLYMAYINGFTVEAVEANRFRRRPRLKDRLLARLIRRVSRRFYSPEVYAMLTSDAVLFGDILVMRLRKQRGPSA